MKNSLLFSVFLLISSSLSFGQTKIDSLKNNWEDTQLDDSIRFESLYNYVNDLKRVNLDSAHYYGNVLLQEAEQNNLPGYRAKAKLQIASSTFRKGNYEVAYQLYQEAMFLAQEISDSTLIAQTYYSIGTYFIETGNNQQALNNYNKSIDILERIKDTLELAGTYNNLAIVAYNNQNYSRSTANYKKSIEYYSSSRNPEKRSVPMKNLAFLKTMEGDYLSAIDLLMEALAIDEAQNNLYNVGHGYIGLANLYFDLEDMDKYFEFTNKSLEIRKQIGDQPNTALTLANLGSGYNKIGEYKKAMDQYDQALKFAENVGRKVVIARIHLYKANTLMEMNSYDNALDEIEKAYDIYSKIDNQEGLVRSYKAFGEYYDHFGSVQQALGYYDRALREGKDIDIKLTNDIAEKQYIIYRKLGNTAKAMEAHDLFESTRDSITKTENKRALLRQEYKYAYDKKNYADSLAFAAREEIQKTKLEQNNKERNILWVVLVIVFGFSIVLYNRIKLINSQKKTISKQNDELQNLNENLEAKIEERTEEIVQINTELKESDERYSYALDASSEGIWDYDVIRDNISFSPAIYTMLGYEPYEFEESRHAIYKLLHSDETKNDKRIEHDLFITYKGKDFLHDEYKLKNKEGKIVFIQVKGKIVEKDNNGKPIRIVGTHTDITELKNKNQEMLEAILRTEDGERSRIAKDIHDGLQQTLAICSMNYESLRKYTKNLPSEFQDKYLMGKEYLKRSIQESRSVSHNLMPKAIIENGILFAIENLINDLNKASQKTDYKFIHNLEDEGLSNRQIEITLYRIIQEALNNIYKYAKASAVDIQLKDYIDIYMLTIEDNGVGFDTKILESESKTLGFKSMKNRLDAVNGFLEVNSSEGKGTTILVEIEK